MSRQRGERNRERGSAFWGFVVSLGLSVALSACAAGAPKAVAIPVSRPQPAPAPRIELARTIVSPLEAVSVQELYQRAQALLADGQAHEAALQFTRVYELDPEGPLAASALFACGEAFEQALEREPAQSCYERLARRAPATAASDSTENGAEAADHGPRAQQARLVRHAAFRALRLATYLGTYARAKELAELARARYATLGSFEQIVVAAAYSLDAVERRDHELAEFWVNKGRTVIEDANLDVPGKIPLDLAALFFALGEVRRLSAERLSFSTDTAEFATELERRCQALLAAQSAYSDVMRAYDSHWSVLAGTRIAILYERLHADVMQLAPPRAANTQAERELFEGAMRLRYAVLLRKATRLLDHTLSLAERTHEPSRVLALALETKAAVDQALKTEETALARLPYSEAHLSAALEHLRKQAQSSPAIAGH